MKKKSFDESKLPRWLVTIFAFIIFGLLVFIMLFAGLKLYHR
jgi:hypothetical protein